MIYQDHYIWFNDMRLNRPWMLQQGYTIIGTYRTLAAAKGAATRYRKQQGGSVKLCPIYSNE